MNAIITTNIFSDVVTVSAHLITHSLPNHKAFTVFSLCSSLSLISHLVLSSGYVSTSYPAFNSLVCSFTHPTMLTPPLPNPSCHFLLLSTLSRSLFPIFFCLSNFSSCVSSLHPVVCFSCQLFLHLSPWLSPSIWGGVYVLALASVDIKL